MAITAAHKTPRGFEVQPVREFQFISEGASPKITKGEVATYLPVLRQDKHFDENFVILAGMIVSRDSGGQLVPANGGAAQTLDYTAIDVDYTVDLDGGDVNNSAATLVAAAKTTAATIAANLPMGWAPYHFYSGSLRLRFASKNYELQPDVAILNRGLIEMPITKTDQATIDEGSLLQSDTDGIPTVWAPGGVADVAQIVGRALFRDPIASYPGKDGLSKVRTVRGPALAGANTDGVHGWLYNKTHDGGGVAVDYIRVNITLLG